MCGDARNHAYHPADPLLPLHESGFGPFHDDSATPTSISSHEAASRNYTIHQPFDSAHYTPQQQQHPVSHHQHRAFIPHQHAAFAPYQHEVSTPHQQTSPLTPQLHTPYQPFGHAPLLSQSFEAFIRHERGVYASQQQSSNYAPHLQPAPQRQQMAFTPQRHAAYHHQPSFAYAPPNLAQSSTSSMMSAQGLGQASPPVDTHFNSGPHPRCAPPAPAQQEAHNPGLPLQTSLLANPQDGIDQYGPQVRTTTTSSQLREHQDYGPYCHPTHLSSTQDASMYHHPLLASQNQPISPAVRPSLPTLPPFSMAASSSSSQPKATTSNRRQLTHNDIYKLNGEMRCAGAIDRAMKRVMARPRRRRNAAADFHAAEREAGCSMLELERRVGWEYGPWMAGLESAPGGPMAEVKKGEERSGEGLVAAGTKSEAQAAGFYEGGDDLWWSFKTEK